jgi:hypothetical protein
MKRSLYGALATLAIFAAPAVAQSDATFKYLTEAAPNAWFNRTGEFVAPSTSAIDPTALDSPFEVFCVDRETSIDPVVQYAVNLTPIDPLSDFSRTKNGQFENYWRAAALVYLYFFYGGTPAGDSNTFQWAIWGIMENTSSYDYIDGGNVGFWRNYVLGFDPNAAGNSTFFTDWRVITDIGCAPPSEQPGDHCYQELIYKSGSPPTEIIPEPATMSLLALGLAGMAGANLRRRKKRS